MDLEEFRAMIHQLLPHLSAEDGGGGGTAPEPGPE
jgi:hypothetical protein